MMIRNTTYIILLWLMTVNLWPGPAHAQDPIRWQDDWRQYQSRNLQEKLFIHPAKTFYLAGEMVWFKIYDVDASTNIPLSFSSIAYAELIDKDQRPVLQARIELRDGNGAGSFRLPATIPSGN